MEPASGPEELHPKSHRPEVGPTEKSETDRERERRAQASEERREEGAGEDFQQAASSAGEEEDTDPTDE